MRLKPIDLLIHIRMWATFPKHKLTIYYRYIKNTYRTRLTDYSLQSRVKMTAYSPHVGADPLY